MKYKIYISIDGGLHENYEPKTVNENNCDNCSLKDYCAKNVVEYPCTLTTIFRKIHQIY